MPEHRASARPATKDDSIHRQPSRRGRLCVPEQLAPPGGGSFDDEDSVAVTLVLFIVPRRQEAIAAMTRVDHKRSGLAAA